MDKLDLILLVIAAWGAILSSYLGIRELRKERRQIRVFLDHIEWVDRFQMIVVNTGHRPVTIVTVAVRPINELAPSENRPIYPSNEDGQNSPSLPVLLNDGESISFLMPEHVVNVIYSKDLKFVAYARDAESKEYTTRKVRRLDAKFDQYDS